MPKNTSKLGNQTTGVVLASLIKAGKAVLLPFGDGSQYDLAYDECGQLVRVECKTAVYRQGCVVFNASSSQRDTKVRTSYRGRADLFGVYCPHLNKVYLVPVADVPTTEARLRVEPSRNQQAQGVRWAQQYEVA